MFQKKKGKAFVLKWKQNILQDQETFCKQKDKVFVFFFVYFENRAK